METFLYCERILKNESGAVLGFQPSLFRVVKSGSSVTEFIFKRHIERKKMYLQCLIMFSSSELIYQVSSVFL